MERSSAAFKFIKNKRGEILIIFIDLILKFQKLLKTAIY